MFLLARKNINFNSNVYCYNETIQKHFKDIIIYVIIYQISEINVKINKFTKYHKYLSAETIATRITELILLNDQSLRRIDENSMEQSSSEYPFGTGIGEWKFNWNIESLIYFGN